MSKGCGCCANVSISKRDFRNSADGPEEMPHKKAGKKKGRGTKRADHKHIWETNGPERTSLCNGDFYTVTRYECLECGKKGDTKFDWSNYGV